MKKLFISIVLCIIAIQAIPQQKTVTGKTPGQEMQIYTHKMYTGIFLGVLGGGIIYAGARDSGTKSLIYVGSGIALAGVVFQLNAISHIGKAGQKLDIKLDEKGLALAYKF